MDHEQQQGARAFRAASLSSFQAELERQHSALISVKHAPVTSGAVRARATLPGVWLTETLHSPHTTIGTHSHAKSAITFVIRGRFREELDGVAHDCAPMTLLYKPAGMPHSNHYCGTGAVSLIVELGADLESDLRRYGDFDQFSVWSGRGVPAVLGLRLYRAFKSGRIDFSLDVEELLLELAARTRRSRRHPERLTPWLQRVRERLHRECTLPLSVSALAREADVHPVYLARVFRARFGYSVGDYLHRRRLDLAVDELLTSGQTVGEIGMSFGYYDQSHFTRIFKRATGLPPALFRRLAARLA